MIALDLDGPLAIATLSRAPVNAIDEQFLARLDGILEKIEADQGISVLLLRSTERAFCAGADLAFMKRHFESEEGRTQFVAFVREIQRVFARLENLPQVTIAEIGASALGGGLELALSCDLRTASNSASLGLPEARLGLLPGAGGTQRLTRIAGESVSRRLILGAEVLTGLQAQALGIVQWVFSPDTLQSRTRALAADIASLPRSALAACKQCISAALTPGTDGFELELSSTLSLLSQPETQSRVRAFLDKRR